MLFNIKSMRKGSHSALLTMLIKSVKSILSQVYKADISHLSNFSNIESTYHSNIASNITTEIRGETGRFIVNNKIIRYELQ